MNLTRLCDVKENQWGKVVLIRAKTDQVLQRLLCAGVLPHVPVSVIHTNVMHVLFFSAGRELAVDRYIASEIYVELESIM